MALSIAKKLYMEVINDSNEVNLSLSNVQGFTFSERARMPVVPCSNEFAIRKLMSSGCHGRHPLDSVRDCSDSLFAVETSQAQFMKRMRNDTAGIAANTAKSYKRKARRSAYTTAIHGWLNMRKPERPYNNV